MCAVDTFMDVCLVSYCRRLLFHLTTDVNLCVAELTCLFIVAAGGS